MCILCVRAPRSGCMCTDRLTRLSLSGALSLASYAIFGARPCPTCCAKSEEKPREHLMEHVAEEMSDLDSKAFDDELFVLRASAALMHDVDDCDGFANRREFPLRRGTCVKLLNSAPSVQRIVSGCVRVPNAELIEKIKAKVDAPHIEVENASAGKNDTLGGTYCLYRGATGAKGAFSQKLWHFTESDYYVCGNRYMVRGRDGRWYNAPERGFLNEGPDEEDNSLSARFEEARGKMVMVVRTAEPTDAPTESTKWEGWMFGRLVPYPLKVIPSDKAAARMMRMEMEAESKTNGESREEDTKAEGVSEPSLPAVAFSGEQNNPIAEAVNDL